MSTPVRPLILAAASLFTGAAIAGEMTLFEYPDFGGRRVTVHGPVSNFDPTGFNDRATSMIIRDGYWEVCTNAYFRGRCARFGPGEYSSLAPQLSDSISSVREVGDRGVGGVGAVGGGSSPRIELWERREYGGRSITLVSSTPDFEGIGFNDRADAAVVYGGVWRLCEHAEQRGQCRDFGPGRYNDLGYLGGKVSSAAPVAVGYAAPWMPSGRPRAILYEGQGFAGRSFEIEGRVVTNLDETGFNDRASSMRVEGGYWVFCTDAHFEGTCRTFGPGEYPTLPWEINRKISSGRRISDQYPYPAPASWGQR